MVCTMLGGPSGKCLMRCGKRLESRGWVSAACSLHFLRFGCPAVCSGSQNIYRGSSSDLRWHSGCPTSSLPQGALPVVPSVIPSEPQAWLSSTKLFLCRWVAPISGSLHHSPHSPASGERATHTPGYVYTLRACKREMAPSRQG